MRVDMVAHVSPDPSDKEVILGTDVHIEYLRIVRRETEQTPVVIVGAICKLGQQIRRRLGDLSALGEPAVELRPLHVQCRSNLSCCALREGILRLVVADPADRHNEERHQRSHEKQLLFDSQCTPSFLKDILIDIKILYHGAVKSKEFIIFF